MEITYASNATGGEVLALDLSEQLKGLYVLHVCSSDKIKSVPFSKA